MSTTPPRDPRTEAYQAFSREADQRLRDFDYIGSIDRFRHRLSGDLFKERAILNLFLREIPNRVRIEDALYTTMLGIRQYASLTFIPGDDENVLVNGQHCLNVWQPPDIIPAEGDPRPFLDLVRLIFDEDSVAIRFFLDAAASLIQTPTRKWAFMILLVGAQGVGKSILCEMLAELVGRRNTAFPTVEAIKGSFTGWLLNAHLVVVHELERMGRDVSTRLKHWITGQELLINSKNVPEFYVRNYANVIACSNHDDTAHLDEDDRRMFIWTSQAQKQAPEYYAELWRWFFEGEGRGIVLDFLKRRDISGFNPNAAPPKTQGRDRLIANSRSEAENFLREALETYQPPFACDLCTASEILQYLRVHQIRCTDAEVRRFLRQFGIPLGQCRVLGARLNLWAIRRPEFWASATHEDIIDAYVNPFDQSTSFNEPTDAGPASASMPVRRRPDPSL
jgi:hypothetical protein